jgi:hypothetical protein
MTPRRTSDSIRREISPSAGLAEGEQELVRVTPDGCVKYYFRTIVLRVGQDVALFDEDKAGSLCRRQDDSWIDAVDCAASARWSPCIGGVIHRNEFAAGLQRTHDFGGRFCRVAEAGGILGYVVEFMRPQDPDDLVDGAVGGLELVEGRGCFDNVWQASSCAPRRKGRRRVCELRRVLRDDLASRAGGGSQDFGIPAAANLDFKDRCAWPDASESEHVCGPSRCVIFLVRFSTSRI